MKKYKRNSEEVDAVQFDGTDSSMDEIRELIGEKANLIDEESITEMVFNFIGKNEYTVYRSNWIVKDLSHFFIVSDDLFKEYFTEL